MGMLKESKIKDESMVFTDIFDKYYVSLCCYAFNFIDDRDTCRDIVQDLFVKLWETKFRNFTDEEVGKYLFRSVKNRCISHIRSQKVKLSSRQEILDKLLEQEELHISDMELRELANRIEQAISKLPEQTALVFEMNRKIGKSYPEIAEELEITEKGVQYHISKALGILRVELKDYLPLLAWIFID